MTADQLDLGLDDVAQDLEHTAPVVHLAAHRCPLCGGRRLEPLHNRHARCTSCGAGVIIPAPKTGDTPK